jgi:MoaD family protein
MWRSYNLNQVVAKICYERGLGMVVRFFSSIRNITVDKEIEWTAAAPTLGDLLRLLSDRYGPDFRRWVLEGERLGSSVMVVVNGNDARHQAGLATELAPTDVVSILPMMAGGSEVSRKAIILNRRARQGDHAVKGADTSDQPRNPPAARLAAPGGARR